MKCEHCGVEVCIDGIYCDPMCEIDPPHAYHDAARCVAALVRAKGLLEFQYDNIEAENRALEAKLRIAREALEEIASNKHGANTVAAVVIKRDLAVNALAALEKGGGT